MITGNSDESCEINGDLGDGSYTIRWEKGDANHFSVTGMFSGLATPRQILLLMTQLGALKAFISSSLAPDTSNVG